MCVEDKVLVRCGDANGRFILRDLRKICSSSSVGRLSRRDKFGLADGSSAILGDSMRGDLRLLINKDTICPVSSRGECKRREFKRWRSFCTGVVEDVTLWCPQCVTECWRAAARAKLSSHVFWLPETFMHDFYSRRSDACQDGGTFTIKSRHTVLV